MLHRVKVLDRDRCSSIVRQQVARVCSSLLRGDTYPDLGHHPRHPVRRENRRLAFFSFPLDCLYLFFRSTRSFLRRHPCLFCYLTYPSISASFSLLLNRSSPWDYCRRVGWILFVFFFMVFGRFGFLWFDSCGVAFV